MAIRLGSQYDKRAFLGAKFKHGWNRLTNAKKNKTDAERLAQIEALAGPVAQLSQEEMRARVEEWRSLGRAGKLVLEGRYPAAVAEELKARGHVLEMGGDWSEGRLTGARIQADGQLRAGANPRGMQGYAVGR